MLDRIRRTLRRLTHHPTASSDERGATAVEYGLMVAFIAAVIITTAAALGVSVAGWFNDMATRWP